MKKKCINLKQKLDRTIYCKKLKKQIKINDCSNCKYKEYKPLLHIKLNSKPKKRTKALGITKNVKLIVWERDNHKCIFCDKYVPWNYANSHYIKRSHGGLGIEQNIMTNCQECHDLFEHSESRKKMLNIAKNHLKTKYDNWDEKDLIYRK